MSLDLQNASPLELAAALAEVMATIKELTQQREAISSRLINCAELGLVPERFECDGSSFAFSAGRRSYDFPAEVTELERRLQAAKEVAIATGAAALRQGKPFWTVRSLA